MKTPFRSGWTNSILVTCVVLLGGCRPNSTDANPASAHAPVAPVQWSTFESELYGFNIERPSTWIVVAEERKTPTGAYIRVRCLQPTESAAESFAVEMMIMPRPASGPSLEERYQMTEGKPFAASGTTRKVATKNGGSALLWRDDRGPVHYDHALVYSGSKMITVSSEFERARPVFERIVAGIDCR